MKDFLEDLAAGLAFLACCVSIYYLLWMLSL